uniref:Chromo domain-containing protein n=1 Tax=Rhabditophanes sp. KR3021 TaxID=114890 RepID=A0AC35UCI2_9BILA
MKNTFLQPDGTPWPEGTFQVKQIINKMIKDDKPYYQVWWEGYSKDDCTWEPYSSFIDKSLIEKYENALQLADNHQSHVVKLTPSNQKRVDSMLSTSRHFMNRFRKMDKSDNYDNFQNSSPSVKRYITISRTRISRQSSPDITNQGFFDNILKNVYAVLFIILVLIVYSIIYSSRTFESPQTNEVCYKNERIPDVNGYYSLNRFHDEEQLIPANLSNVQFPKPEKPLETQKKEDYADNVLIL